MRHQFTRIDDGQLHFTAQQGDDARRIAFVRDIHDVDARHGLEHFRRQMRGAAVDRGRIVKLSRSGFGQRDQLLDRFRRH